MIRLALLALMLAAPGAAQDRIHSRDEFVEKVANRELSRLAVGVTVRPDGTFTGRGWGTRVTGQWDWEGQYFCRSMRWGSRSWDRSCLVTQIQNGRVYFIDDRGTGDQVYLYLP